MTNVLNLPDAHYKVPLVHGFCDDFDHLVTADRWTPVLTDSGTATVGDAAGGILTIAPSDGTVVDNDEAYLVSTAELFLVAADKPIVIEGRLKFTEANTDDANVIFGLMDAAGANSLLDDGGGPAASYDGAVFFKVDGGTRWQVESSNATTQTTTDTEYTAGAEYHTLRIEITPISSADASVTFWIDEAGGQDAIQCRENGANPRTPAIKHTLAISGMQEMHVIAGMKNGDDTNVESLLVDYISVWQKR